MRDRLVSGETTLSRMWVLSAVAVVLGLVGGGAAVGLFKLIGLMTHLTLLGNVGFDLPTLRGYHASPWLIPIAVGGGLLVSVFAVWAPVIRGHGIPESLEAILDRDSRIRPRAAIAKPLSAAITIGTGGPFGAEGPIIVTGGSMGSLLGQLLSVSPAERKIMLATGAAAGMSATFNTPIAAVILAIELVLFERSLRVVVPLSIASGIAAAIHIVAFGAQPLFSIAAQLHVSLAHLPLFVLVGAASGAMAIVLNKGLFAMEAAFRRLPVNIFFWPAIGALGFAVIGLLVPRTLSMGYSAIIDTLNGRFTVVALAILCVAKLLSWLVALGSQTSGGTLAPMFLIGATMGCLLGHAVDAVWPGLHASPAAFALVAMGATFGAATKALFAAVVFAAEVTGEYTMVIPLMIGAGVAELVAQAFLSDRMMTEKLSHRGYRVEFRTAVDALRTRVARQVMREPAFVHADATAAQARRVLGVHGLDRIAVVDRDRDYRGLITVDDLDGAADSALVGPLCHTAVPPIGPQEYLSESLERFLTHRADVLPVVENGTVIGTLGYADVVAERYRRGAAQELRQAGWLALAHGSWTRRRARPDRPVTDELSGAREKIVIPPPASAIPAIPAGPTAGGEGSRVNPTGRGSMRSPIVGQPSRGPGHGRLLPDPAQVTAGLGQFVLSDRSRIVLAWGSSAARPVAERLADELRPATGFRLSVSDGRAYADDICLRLEPADGLAEEHAVEGYALTVGVAGVTLTAPSLHGLHNGTQTLRQLLPVWIASRSRIPGPWTMPSVDIVDFPRFGHRGLMLDLTGQVVTADAVVRLVDAIAGYKLNVLHLRFSPDDAARIIPGPAIGTSSGPASPDRRGDGLTDSWTPSDLRRVVRHAADRFVTVIAGDGRDTGDPTSPVRSPAEHADLVLPTGHGDGGLAAFFCWDPAEGGERVAGVQAELHVDPALVVEQLQRQVFPRLLATAEIGWSQRRDRTPAGPAHADFLSRVGAQGPRLSLTGTMLDATRDLPWRLDLTCLPARAHRRHVGGTIGMLVAPGFDPGRVRVGVDWGDGSVGDGALAVATPGGAAGWYSITAEHEYRRGGAYRIAVTVTSDDAVPARSSVLLRAGSGGRLRIARRSWGRAPAAEPGRGGAPVTDPVTLSTSTVDSPSA